MRYATILAVLVGLVCWPVAAFAECSTQSVYDARTGTYRACTTCCSYYLGTPRCETTCF